MSAFEINAQNERSKELTEKAQIKLNAGDNEGALDLCNQALTLDPNYLDALLKRAFVLVLIKKYEAAIKDYTQIITLQPNVIYAYISRGSAYNKLEKYDLALKDFNSALAIDPENQEAYNNRGWTKKYMGDKEGACGDWKTSKKLGNEEAKIILKNNNC